MDVYLSTISNRINAVMKQLTIIATIFLPLTFITGFFGQNFDWMVSHVHSWPMFLVLGVGSEIAALLALLDSSDAAAGSKTGHHRGDARSIKPAKA